MVDAPLNVTPSVPHSDVSGSEMGSMTKYFSKQTPSSSTSYPTEFSSFAGEFCFQSNNEHSYLDLLRLRTWILGTGASNHMCYHLSLLCSLTTLKQPISVFMPNGSSLSVTQVGVVKLSNTLTLQNVFYIPQFQHNLLSISQLVLHTKIKCVFSHNSCLIHDQQTNSVLATGHLTSKLFTFISHPSPTPSSSSICTLSSLFPVNCNNAKTSHTDCVLWHRG